ncbi:hypothetical protein BH10PSE9_BH10PSE9_20280 [soil metagenome]
MSLIGHVTRMALAGMVAVTLFVTPSAAQEITQTHMAAALAAVAATSGVKAFDNVLPTLANSVEQRLTRLRPDIAKQISAAVQASALKLVVRRKDLDQDVARLWARTFTEQELVVIGTFLKSPAGKKYQDIGPKLITDTFQIVQQWSDRVGSEMLDKTKEELKKQGIEM